jgi:phosphoribosyl 1,2-cyclic phosphodiesterase
MRIKFWGVRGSTPTPQPENMRYGGNTSCVEVRLGERIYIFDCGTGFRRLGQQLQSEFGARPFSAHVFVSHFHWDHIQGMPFFCSSVPAAPAASNKFWPIRWPPHTSR